MKKNFFTLRIAGFTLAEVLITLTIIGVIAALTIPALLQNIQDAQYHTAWKSSFSDLNQAANRLKMDNGGTFNGLFIGVDDMVNKFAPYFSSVKICNYNGGNCWHNANEWYYLSGTARTWGNCHSIILGNGNLLNFGYSAQDCTDTTQAGNTMICGFMYNDINGFKGPNMVGKDIYLIWVTANGLSPAGNNDWFAGTCMAGRSGLGCAAQYLMQ